MSRNTAFHYVKLIPSVKHGGDRIMASGTGWLSITDRAMSSDLDPIKKLLHFIAKKPNNISELRHFCKDEWAKISPS